MAEDRPPIVLQPPERPLIENININDGYNIRIRFREFFRNFRQGYVYSYRDALLRGWNRREYFVVCLL